MLVIVLATEAWALQDFTVCFGSDSLQFIRVTSRRGGFIYLTSSCVAVGFPSMCVSLIIKKGCQDTL